jgi:hypothetical protein
MNSEVNRDRTTFSLWNWLFGAAGKAAGAITRHSHSRLADSSVTAAEQLERRDCPAGFTLTPVVDSVIEGSAAEYLVTMDAPSAIPQYVDITSQAITAQLGTDYLHQNQRLTFLPGQTTKSFFIQSLVDRQNMTEGPETLRVFARPVGGTPSELTATMTINDFNESNDYNIEFEFDGNVSVTLQSKFYQAAERWEDIIAGDLPDVYLPNGQIVDDLLIRVSVGTTPSGGVAEASLIDIRLGGSNLPANRDFSQNGLPYLASILVDTSQVNAIGIDNVLAHEVGHAIGFGALWSAPWINSTGTLVHGVGDFQQDLFRQVPASSSSNPLFIGSNAVREYISLFNTVNFGVPLYDVTTAPPPYWDGSWGVHWRGSVFNDYTSQDPYGEIMTQDYPANGINGRVVPYLISRITVGAFDDLGYTVNYAAADGYEPPSIGGGIPVLPFPAPTPLPQSSSRVLPARISYPDRAPQILANDQLSRDAVRSSLDAAAQNRVGLLDLNHLDPRGRALLAAWASYETYTAGFSMSSSLVNYGSTSNFNTVGGWPDIGPSPLNKKLFASLVTEVNVIEDA